MKFSLKTFLITLCVGGAVVGVMSRLLIVRPEVFLRVLAIGSTVVPFLLVVGTIIWFGFRGKREWKVVAWGLFLLLAPHRLIGQRLPKQIDEPWVWRELEYRLKIGQLSREEVNDSVRQLTSHMKATSPKGWNKPMHWQRDFVAAAIEEKMVSEDVLLELCDAFFGTQPDVPPIRLSYGGLYVSRQIGFRINVQWSSVWSQNSGLGIQRLWGVKQVLLDGAPAKIIEVNRFDDIWKAYCNEKLSPGEHEVQIEVECAYVDDDKLVGVRAAKLPPEQWPQAKKRWTTAVTTTVTAPVKVKPAPME